MATQIKLRRDTAANWTSANPTLAQGEPAVETDTGKFKVGDGSNAWTALGYFPSKLPVVAQLQSPAELVTVSATAATGTVNYDCATQAVLYYTANASANWTLNFRSTSAQTLNALLATGQSLTVVFLNTNGTTAYYPNAFTIDGTAVTPKWSGGTAPSSGNASAIDVYTFTIIKTAANTYTVLAAVTKYV